MRGLGIVIVLYIFEASAVGEDIAVAVAVEMSFRNF